MSHEWTIHMATLHCPKVLDDNTRLSCYEKHKTKRSTNTTTDQASLQRKSPLALEPSLIARRTTRFCHE